MSIFDIGQIYNKQKRIKIMNKKIFSIILSIIFIPTIASAVEYTYTKDGFKYPKH